MRLYAIKWALGAFIAVTQLATFAAGGQFSPPRQSKSQPGSPTYVIANEDNGPPLNNGITFFDASGLQLTVNTSILTGGVGIGGGFFGISRVISLPDSTTTCIYASEAGSGDVAAIGLPFLEVVGKFNGSDLDSGATNGIGLALNANYLYAGFGDSNTIGTFAVGTGCQLFFVGDTPVAGLNGGFIDGMAVSGKLLVVTYGDGSIESFDISGGMPVSNGDKQNSTGYLNDNNNMPSAIDVTKDGRYAIFGDVATGALVEVSDISSGKLKATVPYFVGAGAFTATSNVSSSAVRLSPDESLLYVGSTQGGTVNAAFFDKTTGTVRAGCASPLLKEYYSLWWFLGSLGTRDTTGTGGVVYAVEYPGTIGILTIQSDGVTCSLTEAPDSPAQDPFVKGVLSIWVFPPRPF